MTYTVCHYPSNPANRSTVTCATMAEAKREARKMSGDEPGSCSDLLVDGLLVATRNWTESRLSWMRER